MKKSLLLLVVMMTSLIACGAEKDIDKVGQAVNNTGSEAVDAVKTSAVTTATKISEESVNAVRAMSPEAGVEDFDAAAVLAAAEGKYEAGKDYQVLTPAQPTSSDPSVVEVAEVFMYSCPHCFNFEPFVKRFVARKPVGVGVVRIPAQFNRPAELHAAAYYAAEALGVSEQVHMPLFRAIHNDRNPLASQSELRKIFVANGVSGEDFDKEFSSFEVDTKLRTAKDLNRRYRIQSVPTLVINGKYVTSGTMARSIDRLNGIVDYLVAKELSER